MILHSESDKRLIIKGLLNGKAAYILVDTGATCGIFAKTSVKKYGLKVSSTKFINLVGAGGSFRAYICDTPLILANRPMYQFAVADISSIVSSIKNETGIEIAGLISLPQMKAMNITIDTDDNYVKVGG